MLVAGRRKEIEEVGCLLDRACRDRRGGLLVISGPVGSGKTLLAETAAAGARTRGLQVLWARPATGQPGRLAWVSLLRDTGTPAKIMADLLADNAGPLELDAAAAHLVAGTPRLIVIDDIDQGGSDATGMLSGDCPGRWPAPGRGGWAPRRTWPSLPRRPATPPQPR